MTIGSLAENSLGYIDLDTLGIGVLQQLEKYIVQ